MVGSLTAPGLLWEGGCGVRFRRGGRFLLGGGCPAAHAVALTAGGEHGGPIGEAVQKGRRELLVPTEDGRLFGESEIGGHQKGSAALVPVGQEVEQEFAPGAVEGDKADLVENQEIHAM